MKETVAFEDFKKLDIRVGTITKSEAVAKSEKLLKLEVSLGELGTRTIMAGIAKSFVPDFLIGRRVLVCVNLAPRKMMGVESHGMILAAHDERGVVSLTTINGNVPDGAEVG